MIHWVDNFCKCYAASSMFLNRDLLRQMRWTAHGVKTLPSDIVVDMRWQEDPEGNVKPAMPFLQVLLSDATHDRLIDVLSGTSSILYF